METCKICSKFGFGHNGLVYHLVSTNDETKHRAIVNKGSAKCSIVLTVLPSRKPAKYLGIFLRNFQRILGRFDR